MIGETKTLHPAFRMAVDKILSDMRARGWDPVIGSGMRTYAQQRALYAQGRESLDQVNAERRQAGLRPITASENAGVVTHAKAGESNHNLTTSLLPEGRSEIDVVNGYAVDIVDRREGWNASSRFFMDLGFFAKKYGCEWGGDWKGKYRDVAHIQMKLIDSAPRRSFVA